MFNVGQPDFTLQLIPVGPVLVEPGREGPTVQFILFNSFLHIMFIGPGPYIVSAHVSHSSFTLFLYIDLFPNYERL